MRALLGFGSIVFASVLSAPVAFAEDAAAPGAHSRTVAYRQTATEQPASGAAASGAAASAPASAPAPASASGVEPPPAGLAPPPAGFTAAPPPPGMTSAPPLPAGDERVDTVSYGNEERQRSNKDRISGFMGWAFNIPLGSMRDFTSVVSPLGFEVQVNGWVTSKISIGASAEWATYVDNRPRTTYDVNNAAITATAYNYTQTSAARLSAHYYFINDGPVLPYVGPHVGVSWTTFESTAADLVLTDSDVSVVFGGEAGMEIPMGNHAPVALVNLRYSLSPAAEFRNNVSNVQSIGLMLGIGF